GCRQSGIRFARCVASHSRSRSTAAAGVVEEAGFGRPQIPVKRLIRRSRQAQPQIKTSRPSSTTRETDFGESLRGQQKDRSCSSSRNRTPYPQGNSEYEYF